MTPYEQLLEDLVAEQAALDAVLGGMTDAQWDLPSHAPGWLVRDHGWPMPFYAFGALGIVWALVWFTTVSSGRSTSPARAPGPAVACDA